MRSSPSPNETGPGHHGRRAVAASQHGLDAQDQLARAERLGHVVVRAEFQAGDAVTLVRSSGEHDDRDVGGGAQLARDFLAGHVGQAEVQHDEVRPRVGGHRDRLGAGTRREDTQALALEVAADELPDLGFVLDDQDQRRHGSIL